MFRLLFVHQLYVYSSAEDRGYFNVYCSSYLLLFQNFQPKTYREYTKNKKKTLIVYNKKCDRLF